METLLEVRNLSKTYRYRTGLFRRQHVEAVKSVSFTLREGQTLIEPALCNVGHQQDMHRPARLFAGEKGLSIGFAHVFQPPKEIQINAQVQPGLIFTRTAGVAFQFPAPVSAAFRIQLRIAIGISHPILRPRLLYFQRRHT